MEHSELPEKWKTIPIKELFSFVLGGDWGKDPLKFEDKDYELALCIRGSEIKNWATKNSSTAVERLIKKTSLERRTLIPGDVLIEISGGGPDQPVGRTIYIDENSLINDKDIPLVCTNFLRMMRFHPSLNSKYIQQFLQLFYDSGSIIKYQGGSNNLRNLKFKDFETIKIPIAPRPEQDRIVAKVDIFMAQVETMQKSLERIPQLLKDFRQQVLTQAVTGKLTEEWRLHVNTQKVDSSHFKSYRNKEFLLQNENLLNGGRKKQKLVDFNSRGNNEYGWIKTDIESASLFIVDCLHSTPNFIKSGDNFVIDTTCIQPFQINWNKARKVTTEQFHEWISRLEPSTGDIIFSREGTIGIAVQVTGNNKICIGQRTMIFRFSTLCQPRFMEFMINSNTFKNKYRPFIKGVAAQHLNIRDIRKVGIEIPSIEEQVEIIKIANSLLSKVDLIEKQYQTLKTKIDSLPQAILRKAFKGELVEQLSTDGDAKDLLREIEGLKKNNGKI